jgi:hypothetical protein
MKGPTYTKYILFMYKYSQVAAIIWSHINSDCIGNCKSNYHDHNDPPLCMVVKICQQICDNKTPVTQTKLI